MDVQTQTDISCLPMPIHSAATVLALVDWKKVFKNLATGAADKGTKNLVGRLKSDERERSSKHVMELFVEQFVQELEDKSPLSAAVEGYRDQLKQLLESAAPDIAAYLQPDTKEIDLRPIESIWEQLGLVPLPEDFDWKTGGWEFRARHPWVR
jgi:hypothetical protein